MKIFFLSLFILGTLTSSFPIKTPKYSFEQNIICPIEMFEQKESSYLVFIYLKHCLSCQNIMLRIESNQAYEKARIYYLNLLDFQDNQLSKMQNNQGARAYQEIYLNRAPVLLEIENCEVKKQYDNFYNIESRLFLF